jgi:GNAT superfamily N-acetyltransferase
MQWAAFSARRRGRSRGAPAVGRVRTRIMSPVDSSALHEVFGALSPSSRYLRFHAGASRMTAAMERALLDLDGVRHRALIAEVRDPDRWRPVGIARYVRAAGAGAGTIDEAEVAIEVVDDWQGRGIGLMLLRQLSAEACRAGIGRLVGSVLPDNRGLMTLVRRNFPVAEFGWADGALTVAIATGGMCADAAR